MLGGGVDLADDARGVDRQQGLGQSVEKLQRVERAARRPGALGRHHAASVCGSRREGERQQAQRFVGVLARHQRAAQRGRRAGLLGVGGEVLARVAQAGAPAERARAANRYGRAPASRALAGGGSASGAAGLQARGAIAPTSHGAPTAARPIITASRA